jgi:hypothetical protein
MHTNSSHVNAMAQPLITDVFISDPAGIDKAEGGRRALPQSVVDAVLRFHEEAGVAGEVLGDRLIDLLAGRAAILSLGDVTNEADRDAWRLFLSKVARIAATLEPDRQEAAIARLVDVILPDPLSDARGPLAADNLSLRDRFVAETAPLTSGEVAERAGSTGANRYATAARWKKSGDIFSVQHRGAELFPAFQFRDGRPHPSMRKILLALPANLSAWQKAFWFVSTNGWLNDQAPADVLDDPEAVVRAALREAHEVMG